MQREGILIHNDRTLPLPRLRVHEDVGIALCPLAHVDPDDRQAFAAEHLESRVLC